MGVTAKICLVGIVIITTFNFNKCEIFEYFDEVNTRDQRNSIQLIKREIDKSQLVVNSSDTKEVAMNQGVITKDDQVSTEEMSPKTSESDGNNSLGLNLETESSLVKRKSEEIENILLNASKSYPQFSESLNSTLKHLGINDPTSLLENFNKANASLAGISNYNEIIKSINMGNDSIKLLNNQTDYIRAINRTGETVKTEISKAVLKHQAETAFSNFNKAMNNATLLGLGNGTAEVIRRQWNFTRSGPRLNATKKPDLDPSVWLMRMQAPWKHISEKQSENSTEVIQACKFDLKMATCSADYTNWSRKLWFQMVEAPAKNGINITVFERGHTTRVTFYNRVNGTDCQIFQNGTFHQICVKVYGYEVDQGPTRVCLELGAALFDTGVASTDYGCFRYSLPLRHEDPLDGESPEPGILVSHILANQYYNVRNHTGNSTAAVASSAVLLSVLVPLALLSVN